MIKRRAFLAGTLSAVSAGKCNAQSTTAVPQSTATQAGLEPLVWPVVTKPQPGIRSFAGHTDTVPDIVGRIGTPASLVIFTVSGADQFFVKIAFGRVIDPLRPRALKAFEEFFFSRARDVYPRYDFARMSDEEYGATLALD
jgi:hypothetical protein